VIGDRHCILLDHFWDRLHTGLLIGGTGSPSTHVLDHTGTFLRGFRELLLNGKESTTKIVDRF